METIFPDVACSVETPDERIRIEFPAGAVDSETQVCIGECPASDVPPIPSGFKLGNTYFSIEGITTLAEEITITVKYSDDDVAAAGGDPQLLALAYYDEDAEEWKVLPTTVNTTEKTLTATTDHLSTWAVLAEAAGEAPGEETVEETPFGLPLWIWAAIGAVVVLVAGIVIGRRLARR